MQKTKTLVWFLSLALSLTGFGAEFYVNNGMSDSTGHDGSPPELALKILQDAIRKAADGDTIFVAPGVYGDDQGLGRTGSAISPAATLPGQGVERLTDGQMNPTCAWAWKGKPIVVETAFGEERVVAGARLLAGRSRVNCGVKRASFETLDGRPLAQHVAFPQANTYMEVFAEWTPVACRGVRMTIEETWDRHGIYYAGFGDAATPKMPAMLDAPLYDQVGGSAPTVQIAELAYFGTPAPADLPRANTPHEAYPRARLVRDWAFQDCAPRGNPTVVANATADTTKPDRLGRDVSQVTIDEGAHEKARRDFLAKIRAQFTQFVYVKHLILGNSILFATDDPSDHPFDEYKTMPDHMGGSELCLATILPDGTVTNEVLLALPEGVVRDPAVSPDAKRLVFAMRRSFGRDDYHLYEMDLATRNVKQLTFDGEHQGLKLPVSDIEPCFLPDGSLVFQSTRCAGTVDCWPLASSNLYRCDADGGNIRRIGFDQVPTMYPQLMADGRVVYARWEYNDRNAQNVVPLLTMRQDGTKQTGYFGGISSFPTALVQARGIPGTPDVLAISAGHHQSQKGKLVRIDANEADEFGAFTFNEANALYKLERGTVHLVQPELGLKIDMPWAPYAGEIAGPAKKHMPGMFYVGGSSLDLAPGKAPALIPRGWAYEIMDGASQFGSQWQYPYPLGDGLFLVGLVPEGQRSFHGPYPERFGIYAMDESGRRELLAFDWGNHCAQPVPLRPWTAPRVGAERDDREGFGTYYVQDVYEGDPVKGLKRGSIKKLRVVGLEYRAAHIGWTWQYGPSGMYGKIGTPIAMGNGAYDVKHVLGEVDVEEDGSCSFRAPARTPVYFQLVDAEGCVAQTMRSWSTLQPGEKNSCIGCHENTRLAGAQKATSLALRKPPQTLKPALPGLEHPLLATLEKAGPLASLSAYMGLQAAEAPSTNFVNGGFSFRKTIQPILDRSCTRCHDGRAGRPDLRDVPARMAKGEDMSERAYTKAYVALADRASCSAKVNFSHGRADAYFHPPYTFGAATSAYYQMLVKGHHGVTLADAERRALALWIDLCVPFAGSYFEANTWDANHFNRYAYFQNKRVYYAWKELNEVRAKYGLPPLAQPDGWIDGTTTPKKQGHWAE